MIWLEHLTRIMVARRPETINAAKRVVALSDGQAVELRGVAMLLQICWWPELGKLRGTELKPASI